MKECNFVILIQVHKLYQQHNEQRSHSEDKELLVHMNWYLAEIVLSEVPNEYLYSDWSINNQPPIYLFMCLLE